MNSHNFLLAPHLPITTILTTITHLTTPTPTTTITTIILNFKLNLLFFFVFFSLVEETNSMKYFIFDFSIFVFSLSSSLSSSLAQIKELFQTIKHLPQCSRSKLINPSILVNLALLLWHNNKTISKSLTITS